MDDVVARDPAPATAAVDPALADELLELALGAARAGGELLLGALDGERSEVVAKSSPTDVVTEMDRAAERLVVGRLLDARPSDGVLGEEGHDLAGTSGVVWCLDPIDGTTNYLYRIPGFAVSLAALVDGEAVVGVVVDPLRREEYTARRGGGARRDGRPIRVSGATDLAGALVGTGFSYDAARRRRQAEVLREVLPAVRDLRRGGAASVDLCWVACGRLDAYWERGLQPWDHAAGDLVAREAGARTGDLDGGRLSGDMALAASPALFAPLRDLLDRAGARSA